MNLRFRTFAPRRCQNPTCAGPKDARVHWNRYLSWHICETCSALWRGNRAGPELFAVNSFKLAAYDGEHILPSRQVYRSEARIPVA